MATEVDSDKIRLSSSNSLPQKILEISLISLDVSLEQNILVYTALSIIHTVIIKFMGCLHDPANVQQTSSKCIQNTRANAGRLLDVCWIA